VSTRTIQQALPRKHRDVLAPRYCLPVIACFRAQIVSPERRSLLTQRCDVNAMRLANGELKGCPRGSDCRCRSGGRPRQSADQAVAQTPLLAAQNELGNEIESPMSYSFSESTCFYLVRYLCHKLGQSNRIL